MNIKREIKKEIKQEKRDSASPQPPARRSPELLPKGPGESHPRSPDLFPEESSDPFIRAVLESQPAAVPPQNLRYGRSIGVQTSDHHATLSDLMEQSRSVFGAEFNEQLMEDNQETQVLLNDTLLSMNSLLERFYRLKPTMIVNEQGQEQDGAADLIRGLELTLSLLAVLESTTSKKNYI